MIIFLIIVVVLVVITYLFMLQPGFGRNPSGAAKERLSKSPQFRDGIFQNVEKTVMMAEGVSYSGMMKEYMSKGIDRAPLKDIPTVKTDLKSLGSNPTITWFGHSSYLIHIEGKNILVDPVFSKRTSPVQYLGMASYPGTRVYQPNDFPELDAIIITHDHYDHLDYNSILGLKEKTKAFYTSLGVGGHLERWGVAKEKITEMDWWESKSFLDGFELIATPARHFSGRGLSRNKTLWSSFVLKTSDKKIFIGGDSGYDAMFKRIGAEYGPFDLVIIETGQYDKKWPQIHMAPEEAVQASIDLQGKYLLPVHWAKFTLALHPWKEPVERVMKEASRLNVKVTTPMIGEPVILDESYPSSQWWTK